MTSWISPILDLDPTTVDTDDDGVSDGDGLAGDGNAFIPDLGLAGEDVSRTGVIKTE